MRAAGTQETVDLVRACEPDRSGFAVRSGVRLYYEVHGGGPTTVVLLPPWAIVHSRCWKLQVPYLARYARVVVYDPRGNGRSDRPPGPSAYDDTELVADALTVMDTVGLDDAVVVGLSVGARVLLALAAERPERVRGAVFVGAAVQLDDRPNPVQDSFEVERESYHGWQRWNAHHWVQDQAGFAEFFFGEAFPEPHSTRHVEEAVGWALETDPGTLVSTKSPKRRVLGGDEARAAAGRVACPSLVVHGDADRIAPLRDGQALARALGVAAEVVEGGGHCVPARHPVWFNARLRRFVEEVGVGARG